MASISGRVNEANKLMENGHKFMKTTFLKWTPDHDNAAHQFNQAAMAYKGAGLHKKAIEANDLAIKCYMTSQSSAFQAAKCMEQAALSCKEVGDLQAASNYYLRAIDVFRTLGNLDTAISTLERGAKAVTEKMPTMAADMYIQASELCTIEDRYRQAAEFCNRAANLFLKAKEYRRAANISKEEINCYAQAGDPRICNKTAIGLILLHIMDNNIVAAMDILKSCQMDDDVYGLAQNLVTGFDKKDSKILNTTLNNSLFKNLDTEYAKIAREILNEYGQLPKVEDAKQETSRQDQTEATTYRDDSEDLL